MKTLIAAALVALTSPAALAAAPQVVTDIAPVHGLVAQVMDGVATPVLLIQPGASPHGYALTPSKAAAIEGAQAVFMVGPELTPWLVRPVETLAPDAARIDLLAAPGTRTLAPRSEAVFDLHGARGDEAHDHDEGHDHGAVDPHAWLDPANAKVWTQAIAAELSRIDPANAARYGANAAAALAEIDAADTDAAAALKPLTGARVLAFHDAFQYLERRYGFQAAGSVTPSDAVPPGPRRIAALRGAVVAEHVACALVEPQSDPDLLGAVLDGTGIPTITVDPLGSQIAAGPGFYPALIRDAAAALKGCAPVTR